MSYNDILTDNLIVIKAELLCYGIKPNQASVNIYQQQNPCNDWKTGNVGIFLDIECKSNVLVSISHEFDKRSKFSLVNNDGVISLYKNNDFVYFVKPISCPEWYSLKTSTNKQMPEIFLHEGKNFIHQAYSGCDYHSPHIDKPCKFCGTGDTRKIGSPKEVAEVVEASLNYNNNYHVCLGGGAVLPLKENVIYFRECILEIRKKYKTVPIWVEMIPPESNDDIKLLIEAGATSFGFNIEIWNDELRKDICPGKASISKERYLEVMDYAVKNLDKNHVGSCLLIGIESLNSSLEGIETLTSIGVHPCVLPFKPWDKSMYNDKEQTDPFLFLEASYFAVERMVINGLCPEKNQGCLLCDCCTIEHDIYKSHFKRRSNHENCCS